MYIHLYICMSYIITSNEKEAMNLKEVRRSIWEDLEGGRGNGVIIL